MISTIFCLIVIVVISMICGGLSEWVVRIFCFVKYCDCLCVVIKPILLFTNTDKNIYLALYQTSRLMWVGPHNSPILLD